MNEKDVQELDARGLRCPLPLLKMRQALRHLPQGALLRVLADDAGSAQDIPHWLDGSEHLLVERVGEAGESAFLVKVGGRRPALPEHAP